MGSTFLNPAIVTDTLNISLGPDIAVSVSRKKNKDLSKREFFSSKKQIVSGWEIEVKNNKSLAINLILEDQIPLSNNQQIEVKVDDLSGASLNPETGILHWQEDISPGKSIKKKLIYTIRFPKDLKPILE